MKSYHLLRLINIALNLTCSCFWQNNSTVKGRKKKGTMAKSQSAPSKVGESKDASEITRSESYRELEDPDNSTSGTYDFNAQFKYGDWNVQWDDFYQRYYFCNIQSEESTWDPPPGLENYNILPEKLDENVMPGMPVFPWMLINLQSDPWNYLLD